MIETIWFDIEKLDAYEKAHKLTLAQLGQLLTNIAEAAKRDDLEFLSQFDFIVGDETVQGFNDAEAWRNEGDPA